VQLIILKSLLNSKTKGFKKPILKYVISHNNNNKADTLLNEHIPYITIRIITTH